MEKAQACPRNISRPHTAKSKIWNTDDSIHALDFLTCETTAPFFLKELSEKNIIAVSRISIIAFKSFSSLEVKGLIRAKTEFILDNLFLDFV